MSADPQAVSVELEQEVLGALLAFQTAYDRIADKVEPEDFSIGAHRVVLQAINALAQAGRPVDLVTVSDWLRERDMLASAGGMAYIAEISTGCTSASNLEHHVARLRDKRTQRDMLALSADLAELAVSMGMSSEERIDAAMERVMNLGVRQAEGEPIDIGDVLPSVIDAIQARFEDGAKVSGLPTQLEALDELLGGMQPGDLIVLAGRPSMGKTTLAMNIAENVALEGVPALVFSMEMSDRQICERTIASIGRISSSALRSGRLTEDDFDRLPQAMEKIKAAPLVLDTAAGLSAQQMLVRARRVKRKKQGLGLVVIDYLQLMRGTGNNRNEELGGITRALKLMARDLDCPVIVLSQLNRSVEARQDKRPVMSDLRESGAIEQDADVILMCYRDDYYNPDSYEKGCAEIIVRKNRMGSQGTAMLMFDGAHSRFSNADQEALTRMRQAAQQNKPMKRGRFDE